MNWGHKIAVVIIAFIFIMLSMVLVAYQQTNEMVDKNYYEKELKYQSQIDAAKNANSAIVDPLITQNAATICIQIPSSLVTGFTNGNIEFLRNSDQKMDINLHFMPDSSGQFNINKANFSVGIYKARVQWESGEHHYYREQDIVVER